MQHSTYRAVSGVITIILASLTLATACGDDASDDSTSNNASSTNANTSSTSNNTSSNNTSSNNTSNNNTSTSGSNNDTNNSTSGVSMCGGFKSHTDLADEAACAACVDEACCDTAEACGDDPDCLALRQCFTACEGTTAECFSTCEANATEEARQLNMSYVVCRNSSCSDACAIAEDWSCVGSTPSEVAGGTITMRVVLNSFPEDTPVAGANVKVCPADDSTCATPLAEGTSDDEGQFSAELLVPIGGFDGYLEVTGAGRFPSLLYFNTPPQDLTVILPVLAESTVTTFAALLSVEIDPTRAHAALVAFDCLNRTASGVEFGIAGADGETTFGYISNSLPSQDATETDASGLSGVFNVPAGQAVVSGTRASDGAELFERTVHFREGYVTSVGLVPPQ